MIFVFRRLIVSSIVLLFISCTPACNRDADITKVSETIDDGIPPTPQPDTTTQPPSFIPNRFGITIDKFIGANGFHEEDTAWMQPIGALRAYCNWDWFEGDNAGDQLIFQYSRSGWYFDDAFRKLKDAGVSTIMCFQGAIRNLQGTNDLKFNDKPIDRKGLSTTDPNSYTSISNTLYQIAARYGKTKVDAGKLRSDDKRTGLDLIEYIEVWNEPDKDWEGPDANFSPEEYAAMLSICYDKIKEADPTMKVAMAGLATLSVDYVKRMKAWFDNNRADKKFAADVVNMHIYAYNNKVSWNPYNVFGPAETPEDGSFYGKSLELVNYCRQNVQGAEVWISEFGWDTNKESVLCPKPIDGLTIDELQARWIVRGYLGFAAAGIDRAQVFALVDPSQNYIATQYGTSGLLDRTNNFARKTSWYYVQVMKNALKGLYYVGEGKSPNPDIKVYKFKDIANNNGAYVIWATTSKNYIENNYTLQLGDKATKAEKIELVEKVNGQKSDLQISNHIATIQVSEKPVFVLVDNIN